MKWWPFLLTAVLITAATDGTLRASLWIACFCSSSCMLTWCFSVFSMNVGVAHSEVNPNTRVMNSRGIWLTYLLLTVVLHIILLSIPFFTVPLVWTLTNVIHNLVSYIWSRCFISPWETLLYVICSVCGKCRNKSLLVIRISKQILKKADNFKTTLSSWSLGVFVHRFVAFPAGDVPVSTHSEGNSLRDSRPRQSPSAHTLGTDGLRRPVHVFTEVPHNLSNSSVSVFQVFTWSLVSFTQPIHKQSSSYAATFDFLDKTALCVLHSGFFYLTQYSCGNMVRACESSMWMGLSGSSSCLWLSRSCKNSVQHWRPFPLCRYILASFYTKYDPTHFLVNTCSLLSVLLPKLPQFHGVRIFGINKYWQNWLNTGSFPLSLTC